MGFFSSKIEQGKENAKEKVKAKAKSAIRTAILGANEFQCCHCKRIRNRSQVTSWGLKSRRPRLWTCRNGKNCQDAQGRLKVSGKQLRTGEGWWDE